MTVLQKNAGKKLKKVVDKQILGRYNEVDRDRVKKNY